MIGTRSIMLGAHQRPILEIRDDVVHPSWICCCLADDFGNINTWIWQEFQRDTPVQGKIKG